MDWRFQIHFANSPWQAQEGWDIPIPGLRGSGSAGAVSTPNLRITRVSPAKILRLGFKTPGFVLLWLPQLSVWDCSMEAVCVLRGIWYFLYVVTQTLPLQQFLLYLPLPGNWDNSAGAAKGNTFYLEFFKILLTPKTWHQTKCSLGKEARLGEQVEGVGFNQSGMWHTGSCSVSGIQIPAPPPSWAIPTCCSSGWRRMAWASLVVGGNDCFQLRNYWWTVANQHIWNIFFGWWWAGRRMWVFHPFPILFSSLSLCCCWWGSCSWSSCW